MAKVFTILNKTGAMSASRFIKKLLGSKWKSSYEIHHVDYNENNNSHDNLVVCQDKKYHRLLHIRTNALITYGNANWRKCELCKEYDDPVNLHISKSGRHCYHNKCNTQRYHDLKFDATVKEVISCLTQRM